MEKPRKSPMTENPRIQASILIPFKEWNSMVQECVEGCKRLKGGPYEILLLPDAEIGAAEGGRVLVTGKVRPSAKRNLGFRAANGKILALVDSDAFPREDWLENALAYFKDEGVGAVGGPNLTPPNDSRLQKLGGELLASWVVAGPHSVKYRVGQPHACADMPSCNLVLRKELLEKIGGFDEAMLTGEDAKACHQINSLGRKVLYAPDVIVYHHRRALFAPHLRQMLNYGRDRGILLRTGNSAGYHLVSFAPSGLVVYSLASLPVAFLWGPHPVLWPLSLYLGIMAGWALSKSPLNAVHLLLGGVLTHFAFGIGFIKGFLQPKDTGSF